MCCPGSRAGCGAVSWHLSGHNSAVKLEPTELRILGVLMEKELAVPDGYPLTENSLLAGCNQKSNRDPVMELEDFQLSGALAGMLEQGILLRVSEAGSRTVRYKHLCEEKLGLNDREKAVLAELLVRGPQAPGALKQRVARMGMAATPAEILVVLEGLRVRLDGALVEQLPRQPREREQRWTHLLGGEARSAADEMPRPRPIQQPQPVVQPEPVVQPQPEPVPDDLADRVARLERRVVELEGEIQRLRD